MTYISLSIAAGPRFLSVGFIMMFLFFRSFLRAASCSWVRFERLVPFSFEDCMVSSFLRAFSKRVSWFSIFTDARGGVPGFVVFLHKFEVCMRNLLLLRYFLGGALFLWNKPIVIWFCLYFCVEFLCKAVF